MTVYKILTDETDNFKSHNSTSVKCARFMKCVSDKCEMYLECVGIDLKGTNLFQTRSWEYM